MIPITLGLAISCSTLKADEKPNIVVILADDLGYGDVQAYNPEAGTQTPNLDRLAADGVRFLDGHANASVCSPTRYGLLTGRYAWRSSLKKGVLMETAPLLIPENCDTLASLLKRNGYYTAIVGKWHLGLGGSGGVEAKFSTAPDGLKPGPNQRGFDYSFLIHASLNLGPYVYLKDLRPVNGEDGLPTPDFQQWAFTKGGGKYPEPYGFNAGRVAPGFDPHFDSNPSETPRFNKVLHRLTTEAVDIIDDRAMRPEGQPFFLYFALTSPHTPWVPDVDTYGMTDEQVYMAYVKETDHAVGRIMEALKKNNLQNNTLVAFTSDNGPELRRFDVAKAAHHPAGNFRGMKSHLYEGGHREPFIVSWPGHIPPGSTSDQLICTTDFYRTFASIVGDRRPGGMIGGEDSEDFSKLFRGEKVSSPIRAELIHHSSGGRFAIRMGDWKYIDWGGSGGYASEGNSKDRNPQETPGQLFNLAKDPGEKNNLYASEPGRVAEMKAALVRIQGPDAPSSPAETESSDRSK